MAVSLFTTLFPDVLPFVRECPEIVAINAIRNAAIELTKKSRCWQVDLLPISVVAGQSDYPLDAGTDVVALNAATGGCEIAAIMFCTYNGWPIPGKSPDELAKIYRWFDWRSWQGDPKYYNQLETNSLFVVPQPVVSVTGFLSTTGNSLGLQPRAAFMPTRAATGMDAVQQERYYEGIAMGARARLYEMSGQPFADPAAAALFNARFQTYVNKVRIEINTGNQRNSEVVEKQGYVL